MTTSDLAGWLDVEPFPSLASLDGRQASLLGYYITHSTVMLGIEGATRNDDTFIVLHNCGRLEVSKHWTIGHLEVIRTEEREREEAILIDASASVRIRFHGGRWLSRRSAIEFAGADETLRHAIDNFNP